MASSAAASRRRRTYQTAINRLDCPPAVSDETLSAKDDRGAYTGWAVGFAVIAAILLIGVGLWLKYHP